MKRKKMLIILIICCVSSIWLNAQILNNLRPPAGTRFFDGLNPFLAPVNTTNYYGSGDVNLDGVVDSIDCDLVLQMLRLEIPENPRADVNGDGRVNATDLLLIQQYLTYSTPLPGWWDQLTTREARKDWVDKMLAIDDTDALSYVGYSINDPSIERHWFVCINFALQLTANFTGQRIDCLDNLDARYNWGPTRYNIPMYYVSLPDMNHAINAVLIGDDPTNFFDWYFIEPQQDADFMAGQNGSIDIGEITIYVKEYSLQFALVKFNWIDPLNVPLISADTALVTSRPSPPPPAMPDNRKDYWNPYILNENGGKVLFDTTHEDIDRYSDMDVHESTLPFSTENNITVAVDSEVMGHLLDVYQDPYGTTHVLYIDKPVYTVNGIPQNIMGIYYGIYDETQSKIINAEPILEEQNILTEKAEMVMDSLGKIHVFWYFPGFYDLEEGIYWTYKDTSGWQTPMRMPTLDNSIYVSFCQANWKVRNFNRGIFSTLAVSGNIYLAWVGYEGMVMTTEGGNIYKPPLYTVQYSVYDGSSWSAPARVTPLTITPDTDPFVIIEPGSVIDVTGVCLEKDNAGNIHLVYQRGDMPSNKTRVSVIREGRGVLEHMIYDGSTWSPAVVIDNTETNLMPRMDLDPASGNLYLIWEKKVNDQVKAAWSKFNGTTWSTAQTLPIRPNADAWYPTVKVLDSGAIYTAFSSRCPDQVIIETYEIDHPPVTIYYENHETAASTYMLRPWLKIKNEGTTSIDLEDITIRYWYTRESAATQNGNCISASCGGNNITSYVNLNFVPLVPGMSDANYYLEISFDSGAGSLETGEETGPIQLAIWNTNYSLYTQTDDYSFDLSMTTFAENTNITGYLDNTLCYGNIPE